MLNTVKFLNRKTPPHIVTLVLLAGLSALTMNIFLPSLPGMAAYFNVPYSLMQLSVALYLALSAVLQILIGPISDRYGRRKVVLTALVLFLVLFLLVVLFVFYRLVTKHAPALYGPADLGAENFLAVHKVAPEKASQSKRFDRWLAADPSNRAKLDAWIKERGLNTSITSFIYNSNLADVQNQAIEELKIPEVA